MVIECPKHGITSAVTISEDLLTAGVRSEDVIRIGFSVEGSVVGVMLLSPSIASARGLEYGEIIALEEDGNIPAWAEAIQMAECIKCLQEKTGIAL